MLTKVTVKFQLKQIPTTAAPSGVVKEENGGADMFLTYPQLGSIVEQCADVAVRSR